MGRSADLPRPARPRAGQVGDDRGCTVLHVDMDAFYASVEARMRPELAGLPLVVAGGSGPAGERGVVLSASYEARACGVRSAMPVAQARRLCPQARFVPPRFPRYAEISRGVLELFGQTTPLVEPLSLDEAFLDVAGALRRLGMGPAAIGERIRGQVSATFGLTCSVGVAPSKFLAKLASGLAKPDGLLVVPADRVLEFLHPLPVSALWGVGQRTAEVLHRLGCRTVADVAALPLTALRRAVGPAAAEHLHGLANGRDERPVVPDAPEKSVGAEATFAQDVADRELLRRELLRLAERATATLRRRGLRGRRITVKIRYPDFATITRSRTLADPTDVGQVVFGVAVDLLDGAVPAGTAVRLLGVRVERLVAGAGAEQLTLDGGEANWSDVERAADAARARFGGSAVTPAALVDSAWRPVASAAHTPPETATHIG